MDLSKLSLGDKIIAGSGIALFIFSFLPWYKVEVMGISGGSVSGWHYFFTGIVPTLLGLVLLAWVVATKVAEIDLPELPVPQGLLLLGLGALAAVLVVLRLLLGAGEGAGITNDYVKRAFGLFLSTIAAIGLGVGGFFKFQDDGGQLPKSGGQGGGSQPPTPF